MPEESVRNLEHWRRFLLIPCQATSLLPYEAVGTSKLFNIDTFAEDWAIDRESIVEQGFTSGVGGVNEGDRRAIYYLIRHFKPNTVLEVGTHIGASTVHIATPPCNATTNQRNKKSLCSLRLI